MEKQRLSRKILHICIVFVIIIAIIFVAIMLILHYDVNGETNMPFFVSKISIISTVDGKDVENNEAKWDIKVIQNNDVFVYIEKNEEYKKQETIDNITIDNITVKSEPSMGEIKIYKPILNETTMFKNLEENEIQEVVFNGAKATDTRNLEISNQGGTISFRCANNSVGEYFSNDDEQISYEQLLQKMNIEESNLKATISFNISIKLNSGKTFKAENIEIEVPNEDIVKQGTVGLELTDLQNIIFKRLEN